MVTDYLVGNLVAELTLLRLLLGLFSFSLYSCCLKSPSLCGPAPTPLPGVLSPGSPCCSISHSQSTVKLYCKTQQDVSPSCKSVCPTLENRDEMEAEGPMEEEAGVPGVGAMSSSIRRIMGSACKETLPACIHFPDLISSSCFFRQSMQTQITWTAVQQRTAGLAAHLVGAESDLTAAAGAAPHAAVVAEVAHTVSKLGLQTHLHTQCSWQLGSRRTWQVASSSTPAFF